MNDEKQPTKYQGKVHFYLKYTQIFTKYLSIFKLYELGPNFIKYSKKKFLNIKIFQFKYFLIRREKIVKLNKFCLTIIL